MVIAISLPFLSEQAFLPGITVSGGTFVLLSFMTGHKEEESELVVGSL